MFLFKGLNTLSFDRVMNIFVAYADFQTTSEKFSYMPILLQRSCYKMVKKDGKETQNSKIKCHLHIHIVEQKLFKFREKKLEA